MNCFRCLRAFAIPLAATCASPFVRGVAAQEAPTVGPLSVASVAHALEDIAARFTAIYVDPELRPRIVERLDREGRAGRYDVDDPKVFADRVTSDLRDVARDEHLALTVDPAAYAAAVAPAHGDAGEDAFRRRGALRRHHGLAEMRILPGNLRYLRITRFDWVADETGSAYDAAMRFLKDGDAWIVDLRGNGGGTSAAAHYFVSHFLAASVHDYTALAGDAPPERSLALDHLPAGRLIGKPLFVLVDGETASAAEAVAYDLQQFRLATIVGAKTVGAANNNRLLPIAPCFILSVSYGRPVHVVSQTNWEGVGVEPDVACAPAQAPDMAQELALAALTAAVDAPPEARLEYAWASVAVAARLHPVTFPAARLQALAAHYGEANVGFGELEVVFAEGSLWLQRPGRPTARLVPMIEDGTFAIEGNERLRARLTGQALELLWWTEREPRVFARR